MFDILCHEQHAGLNKSIASLRRAMKSKPYATAEHRAAASKLLLSKVNIR